MTRPTPYFLVNLNSDFATCHVVRHDIMNSFKIPLIQQWSSIVTLPCSTMWKIANSQFLKDPRILWSRMWYMIIPCLRKDRQSSNGYCVSTVFTACVGLEEIHHVSELLCLATAPKGEGVRWCPSPLISIRWENFIYENDFYQQVKTNVGLYCYVRFKNSTKVALPPGLPRHLELNKNT